MISYIYNNYLNSYSHAIHNYNLFLKNYPNDDLAPSVQYELKGLEKYKNQIDSLNNAI
jgi:TolA-binding protein